MKTTNYGELKADILSAINSDKTTVDDIIAHIKHFGDSEIVNELQTLVSSNTLKFNKKSKQYSHAIEPNGDKIICDGNILLPVTIMRNENETIVSRGFWYSFPPDFDTNRIIWNVAFDKKTSSSLVDLLEITQQKMRKTKVTQLPEYQKLVNIIIPFNDDIKFIIDKVGEVSTLISIMFIKKLYFNGIAGEAIEFRGFRVKSEILTENLLIELRKNPDDRDFSQIKLNNVFNFSDLIFSKNQIPYFYDGTKIEYVELDKIRGEMRLVHYSIDKNSVIKELDVEKFVEVSEGLNRIKELYSIYMSEYLEKLDFSFD